MISLRNIPFFAVGVAALLFGLLVFKNDCPVVWYIIALIYFVLGFAFRKPIDTADGGH
jgi:membrane protease YdiL (CAAX protease family)